jgi:hypothetical protein
LGITLSDLETQVDAAFRESQGGISLWAGQIAAGECEQGAEVFYAERLDENFVESAVCAWEGKWDVFIGSGEVKEAKLEVGYAPEDGMIHVLALTGSGGSPETAKFFVDSAVALTHAATGLDVAAARTFVVDEIITPVIQPNSNFSKFTTFCLQREDKIFSLSVWQLNSFSFLGFTIRSTSHAFCDGSGVSSVFAR